MTEVLKDALARRFATRAVHAGQVPDPLAGAVMTPIYQTSTYIQDGLGRNKGYEYARTRNPTREALERNVAALEGGRHGFAFGSGLAAVDTVLKLLSAGDHVVCGENVYGGTHRQMTHIWARLGLTFTFVDGGELAEVKAAITPVTKMVYAETPTNPMMRLCDLAATGEIARKAKALFVVDNTFATPCFQRPLELGADIVLHSTTKYLNGHSDMVGGMLRGGGPGDGGGARRRGERTKIFVLAESRGGVESLVGHPASMTHASVPAELKRKMGLTDSLVRLSVGIEDVEDLIADLDQALGDD